MASHITGTSFFWLVGTGRHGAQRRECVSNLPEKKWATKNIPSRILLVGVGLDELGD
jgi:hypothetical protein